MLSLLILYEANEQRTYLECTPPGAAEVPRRDVRAHPVHVRAVEHHSDVDTGRLRKLQDLELDVSDRGRPDQCSPGVAEWKRSADDGRCDAPSATASVGIG